MTINSVQILNSSISRHIFKLNQINIRNFRTSSVINAFFEKDEKGGYVDKRKQPSRIQLIRDGLKELKHEVALWKDEVKERFDADPIMTFRPGETDVIWDFKNEETLKQWVVTSDQDHNEGYSTCSLISNKHGKGHFIGELNTQVPKDGRIKKSGYCNMRTMRIRKSFKRDDAYDWHAYNMLVMKVRGDGRSYMLNINTKGFFDLTWNDTFHYVLFTRGGPYWQISKIPFSKFFFASKGRVQDRQYPIPLNRITNFGLSVGDKINGSFSLEIDYIGLEYNPNHKEEFAYEMYKMPKYMIPFSKFFFASKGRVQDRQYPIPLNRITNFGLSVGDKINGSFSLEIDYIGLEYNPNHKEEFAYEMYKMPKYMVAT